MAQRVAEAKRSGRTVTRWFTVGWGSRRLVMVVLLAPFLVDGGLILLGRGGLFGVGPGVAVREVGIVAALVGFLLVNTRTLRRIDQERRQATESLQVRSQEQARTEEELRESERRYRFLTDAVPQMVWTARADGATDYFNQRWFDYTGQTLEESRGWGWMPVIHPEDLDRCTRRWMQAFQSGERYEIEYRFRRFDGEYRWQLGRADPMRDETGAVVHWFGTCTDIDDQKRVEAELRSTQDGLSDRIAERTAALETANLALVAEVAERKLAEEAAQAASQAKGEFLANMSHEIRTPMNGILGMTELTLGTDLSPTQREYLGIVASSADALLTVINDILDFSKIEAGKLELDPILFPLRDTITDTLRSLALRANDKGLELACRIAPEVPDAVVGDPGRLRQILVNLVGNAIKFTERGEVVVTVALAPDAEPAAIRLRFAVSDTGIGIPASKRAAIFAPFEQADGSTTRKHGGTGLGLSISSKLVNLMGGAITVDANPDGGSRFAFEARFDAVADLPSGVTEPDPTTLHGRAVLVVDDNATNRRILLELLLQWGCRPVAVTGADQARAEVEARLARDDPFAVVLLDHMMPGMDGRELADSLRSWEAGLAENGPRLKLVMLTSGGRDAGSRPEGGPLDAWLAKPVRQSELFDTLVHLLDPAGEVCRLEPDQTQATMAEAARPAARPMPGGLRPLTILLAEDHPINQRVATRMIEDLGHHVTVVGNGRLAVEASASGRFDLVLMDVQMPELDGFEALAAIRGRELLAAEAAADRGEPTAPPLPIVALTAHAMTGDRARCLAAGFDDYLSKPVHAARLREILDRFLAAVPPEPIDHFDRRSAVDAMGGDEALLDEVIRLFLDDTPRLLAQIHAAIEVGDQPALIRLGHTVAGVASNFGPNPVVTAARQVEDLAKTCAGVSATGVAASHLDRAFNHFQAELLAGLAVEV